MVFTATLLPRILQILKFQKSYSATVVKNPTPRNDTPTQAFAANSPWTQEKVKPKEVEDKDRLAGQARQHHPADGSASLSDLGSLGRLENDRKLDQELLRRRETRQAGTWRLDHRLGQFL